ncbi:unnamed protein product [Cuscuta epithymum]|uniref:Peptidase A1 domain-containing protein n=1 Tax=Cuscuta epithymum TaxID=186058 RepID=A0AAV0FLN2_9ASTE|nr:unnamed protein product [Cuscuta epithymum]
MYWLLFFLAAMAMGVSSSPNNNGVFEIYDRYSSEVVEVLGKGGLPKKGGLDYISYMAARDSRRRQSSPAITFSPGDATFQMQTFADYHFVKVYVGTPPMSFMVALDTGSSLFWLPCNCNVCSRHFTFPSTHLVYTSYLYKCFTYVLFSSIRTCYYGTLIANIISLLSFSSNCSFCTLTSAMYNLSA